jgi:hypothetical protein
MDDAPLTEAVRILATAFERRAIRHALIGGLAVSARSRERATKDADFILQVPALALPGLLEELVAEGFNIDVIETIRRWSVDRFVVFYRGPARVDWMQPVVPLYTRVLDTAKSEDWLDAKLNIATAEGLILTKMVAFRLQDQTDIETLLAANRDDIDLDWIRREWSPYAPTEPDRTAWLEQAIARIVPPRP